jgi:hypothetical protein
MAAAALAVMDELVLPLRAVRDLAAAAGLSREEVVVITQCASLSFHFPISRFLKISGLNAQLLLCFIRRKFAVRQGGQEDGHKIHNLCQSSCLRLYQVQAYSSRLQFISTTHCHYVLQENYI